jgi:AcrR family transcriptional regulator
LLRRGGVEAVSTRSVAAAAGVQPPAIYRQFGDKDGLLDAVTSFVFQRYLREKRRMMRVSADPVEDLRRLWDLHVEFGLSQPYCYSLTFGRARPGAVMSGAAETQTVLMEAVARVGAQGALKMSVEHATSLVHSCGVGFVLTQINVPKSDRTGELSTLARETVFAAILNEPKRRPARQPNLPGRAVALHEALRHEADVPFTSGERELLSEWLMRLANQSPSRV